MKKMFLAVLAMLSVAGIGRADTMRIDRSSFTTTNETVWITSSTNLVSINVGVASSGGVLTIYNSTFSTSAVVVSSISLGSTGSYYYGETGVELKGIFYKTVGNSNGVCIIYKK